MLSKIISSATLLLALSAHVNAHAAVAPALGVQGAPKRSDVQRPSNASPCGNVNIASTIDSSTPVTAAADGSFTVTATNFNAGADGSRSVTASVDQTGAGKSFVAATVSKNGDAAPTSDGSDQIVVALPAGTACTGGATKNKCLVSFKTTAGFGNCVVVQQAGGAAAAGNAGSNADGAAVGAAAGAAAGAATASGAVGAAKDNAAAGTGAANTGAAAGGAAGATGAGKGANRAGAGGRGRNRKNGAGKKAKHGAQRGKVAAGAGGTRNARAFQEIEDSPVEKRGVLSWIWA